MLAVVDAKALVFPADEDGRYDVSENEDSQKDIMQLVVVFAIEDGEEDETSRTDNSSECGACIINFLPY